MTLKETHAVVIGNPGNLYIDHLSPETSDADCLANDLFGLVKAHDSVETLRAVGADGCAKNVGCKGGVIANLERKIGRSLHHFICILHFLELPLRHMFQHYVGKSTGPNTSEGDLAVAIESDLTCLPVINFKPLPGFVTNDFNQDSSSCDQGYFHSICLAVQEGYE